MSGSSIIVIGTGGGTVPRAPNTFPVANIAGDYIENNSDDPAFVEWRQTGSGLTQELTVLEGDKYTFGNPGSILAVT